MLENKLIKDENLSIISGWLLENIDKSSHWLSHMVMSLARETSSRKDQDENHSYVRCDVICLGHSLATQQYGVWSASEKTWEENLLILDAMWRKRRTRERGNELFITSLILDYLNFWQLHRSNVAKSGRQAINNSCLKEKYFGHRVSIFRFYKWPANLGNCPKRNRNIYIEYSR